jgi:septal ring factor EnvC (AmiA/AmiB activator)
MPSKIEERLTRHDREIAAIRKLLLAGMKMLARTDRQIDNLAGKVDKLAEETRELAAAQRQTDRMLKSLISSLERGSNGHSKS